MPAAGAMRRSPPVDQRRSGRFVHQLRRILRRFGREPRFLPCFSGVVRILSPPFGVVAYYRNYSPTPAKRGFFHARPVRSASLCAPSRALTAPLLPCPSSDAFAELHAKLPAEQDEGADPEDADEYRVKNVFWFPREARWEFLQNKAKQPSIGKLVDQAMDAIERDNPSLKGVLPKQHARRIRELRPRSGERSYKPMSDPGRPMKHACSTLHQKWAKKDNLPYPLHYPACPGANNRACMNWVFRG